MEQKDIWLIDHKATLGEYSPLNMDGSEWILGICVLHAGNQQQALQELSRYLQENEMDLIETYQIAQYQPEEYADHSDRSEQINYAARRVLQDGETCYVYARTSETIKAMEEEENGND
jgi:hypothetical protein